MGGAGAGFGDGRPWTDLGFRARAMLLPITLLRMLYLVHSWYYVLPAGIGTVPLPGTYVLVPAGRGGLPGNTTTSKYRYRY